MLVWADSRWTLEKLQVEMQLVKGVNGFVNRIRTGGQVQFGVRVLPDQLSEVRAKVLPNDVRYTDDNRHIQELQHWRLGPLLYTMQPPEIVDMFLEWSRKAGVPWPVVPKAPDPRQRTKNGHFWFVAAEGRPPLNEISLLNRKVFLTKEVIQGEERQSKVRPSVWTKLKEEKEHGEDLWTTQDPWSKTTHMVPAVSTNKRKNRTEDGERPRSRTRSASSLSDMQVEGERSEKVPKPPAAFEKIAQQQTRKEMHVLEQKMNQHVLGQNERLKSLETLITENQKRTEKQDGPNGGSHQTGATDAAENRDDVPAILGESPRRGR